MEAKRKAIGRQAKAGSALEDNTYSCKEQAPNHARRVHGGDDQQVLGHGSISAHENHEADARRNQQARHHGTCAQHALEVELGDKHACRAVGNQADERRGKDCNDGIGLQEVSKGVFPDKLESRVQDQGDDEDEEAHLGRVQKSAFRHAAPAVVMGVVVVMAVMIVTATVIMSVRVVVAFVVVMVARVGVRGIVVFAAMRVHVHHGVIRAVGIMLMIVNLRVIGARTAVAAIALAELMNEQLLLVFAQKPQNGIHDKAHQHADDDLGAKDLGYGLHRHLLGYEDGKHLIGGGQKHREDRTQGNHAASVERRSRSREAALGHGTEQSTYHRARCSSMADGLLRFRARLVFKPLHGQVGHEKEGYEIEDITYRMADDMLDDGPNRLLPEIITMCMQFVHSGAL